MIGLFSIVEAFNKLAGLATIWLLARSLDSVLFSEFLYYQNIFSYLIEFSVFATAYANLAGYGVNKTEYLKSDLHVVGFILRFVFSIISILIILFLNNGTTYNLYDRIPTFIAIIFAFDFILYVEKEYKKTVIIRFSSQCISLFYVWLIYVDVIPAENVFGYLSIQSIILTFGSLYFAKKYIRLSFKKNTALFYFNDWNKIKTNTFRLVNVFLSKSLLVFIVSIELILLKNLGHIDLMEKMAVGLRLTLILTPFVFFYLSFQSSGIKDISVKKYSLSLLVITALMLFISPIYTSILFGSQYVYDVWIYNFFLAGFLFDAYQQKNMLYLLQKQKEKILAIFNITFFICYISLIGFFIYIEILTLEILILLFFIKLTLYSMFIYLIFKKDNLDQPIVISLFALLLFINILLYRLNYYSIIFDNYKSTISALGISI